MIPKVIHYCWFGRNPKPELIRKCISSWKKYCPDYIIKEWNEDNFDVNACAYIKEAYEHKKWAFVSDYARLYIIYHEGGIYLDTDIELIKPLDELLWYDAYFGYENKENVNTGLGFGAVKGEPVLEHILRDYHGYHFLKEDGKFDVTPCPVRNSAVLRNMGFQLNGETTVQNGIAFLSTEWLSPMDYDSGDIKITGNTISIHHYSGAWMSKEELIIIDIERRLKKIIGKKFAFWVRCRLYNVYNFARKLNLIHSDK